MYTEFFGLNEKPFSISPDPRYLYLSRRHADALAHLIYGISESGGFIQLTGEVGTGKTTLIRSLLEQLPEKAEIALILNPQLSKKEFLQAICQELRIDVGQQNTVKSLIDSLNEQLLRANAEDRRIVLIVDEAQTLSTQLLEQVRLLTNLETAKKKLLQIILIGQPELREILDRPEMRQIAQRVTGRYHLEPLSKEDGYSYIQHRMKVAGAQSVVFEPSAMREILRQSRGIPRLINVVADRSLLAAYTEDCTRINGKLVRRAAGEVFGKRPSRQWWPWALIGGGLLVFAITTTNLLTDFNENVVLAPAEPATITPLPALAAVDLVPTSTPALLAAAASNRATPGEAAAVLSLDELLNAQTFPTDSTTAASELFKLWGADYDSDAGSACDQAIQEDLQCMYSTEGSISQLRRVNRPAILSLTDATGSKHQVVMTSLGYDHAQISADGRVQQIDLVELTHRWFGEHLLLWKPGVTGAQELAPGMQNTSVRWLRESLAAIRGSRDVNSDSLLYDIELEEWVRAYQRDRNLDVDGIVGARTQIAIHTDTRPQGIPMLSGDY